MKDNDETGLTIALGLALAVPAILIKMIVIVKLWQWYAVTSFNLPPVTIAQAFGLSLLINYLLPTPQTKDRTILVSVIGGFLSAGSVLLFGWIGTYWL